MNIGELLHFNGIDGTTGDYLLPAVPASRLGGHARDEQLDPVELKELMSTWQRASGLSFAVEEGLDANNLAEAGWGVVFAEGADPAVREALAPLLEHRRAQAKERYRELSGSLGYRPGESKNQFLARHNTGPGPVDPDRMPYYLLLVGGPETIPWRFQYQLDVQYGVGRIHFDTPEEYASYAKSVVAAETTLAHSSLRATFFGPSHDPATRFIAESLLGPLAKEVDDYQSKLSFAMSSIIGGEATKARLCALVGGPETPTLLFAAGHGMGFPAGHPLQQEHQGALLCQDWPGPGTCTGLIPSEHYFSAADVTDDANVAGMIAFFFASYGAGTPERDDPSAPFGNMPSTIAPHPFAAHLPRRLLGHPKGGALAVVGHIDRAWSWSFEWPRAYEQLAVFESTMVALLHGVPIGKALENFNMRYAELTTQLTGELEEMRYGGVSDDLGLAGLWMAAQDARNFVVLGDPAVRLRAP